MRNSLFVLLLIAAASAGAQEPTEFYDCVDDADGPNFCSDSTAVLVDESCGSTFNRYHGTIAWPVLRNVGPVTISVQTRYLPFGWTFLPLYVEVRGRTQAGDDMRCRTGLGGHVILVAQGGSECGGAWESAGPISLIRFGVPMGALYNVQAVFFEALPDAHGIPLFTSIGFSCIRVTSHPTAVVPTTWTNLKALYR